MKYIIGVKISLVLALAILVVFPLPGQDQSIIYLRFSDSGSLDPGKSRSQYSGEVTSNIFEGLVHYQKGSQKIAPCLAESWTCSRDGKKWTFNLRRGVRFHNGGELDADSVVYSFSRRMRRGDEYIKWKLFFPYIRRVQAIGKYRVEILLDRPFAPFLTALTDPVAFIVAPGAMDDPDFKPIGSGPFIFREWEKGRHIILEKNPDYWEKEINIDKIVFKVVLNPTWRIEQLKNQSADVIAVRSADEYNQLVGIRDIEIITTSSHGTFFLAFNTTRKPFDRMEVRKAFAHLIDKEVLIKQIFQDFATPARTPLPPVIKGFNSRIDHYPFDMEKARDYLNRAGMGDGFTCTLYFLKGDVGEQKIADVFARNARKVKVTVIKKALPFQELFEKINRREHDMIIRGWVAGPDPDIFLYANFTTGPGNMNWSYYDNPELVSLLNRAREELDTERRLSLYRTAQEIIHRDVPWIPLYHLNYLIVHRSGLKNIYFNSNSYIIFRDVSIGK